MRNPVVMGLRRIRRRLSLKAEVWITVIAVSPLVIALVLVVLNFTILSAIGRSWTFVTSYAPYLALFGLCVTAVDLSWIWIKKRLPVAAWIDKQIGLPTEALFLLWFTDHKTCIAETHDLSESEKEGIASSDIFKELLRSKVLLDKTGKMDELAISRRIYRWLINYQDELNESNGQPFNLWTMLSFGKAMLISIYKQRRQEIDYIRN